MSGHVLVEFKQPKGQAVVLLAHHAPHGFCRIHKRKCSADGAGLAPWTMVRSSNEVAIAFFFFFGERV